MEALDITSDQQEITIKNIDMDLDRKGCGVDMEKFCGNCKCANTSANCSGELLHNFQQCGRSKFPIRVIFSNFGVRDYVLGNINLCHEQLSDILYQDLKHRISDSTIRVIDFANVRKYGNKGIQVRCHLDKYKMNKAQLNSSVPYHYDKELNIDTRI